VYVELEYWIG